VKWRLTLAARGCTLCLGARGAAGSAGRVEPPFDVLVIDQLLAARIADRGSKGKRLPCDASYRPTLISII
jgi:hypothetical protein